MKRQSLLFIAGGLMALASCTNEATTSDNMSQAQIDSAVNARVEEISMQMMASNDSLINEMAMMKADSICGAMGGKTTTTVRKPVTKAPSKPTNGGVVTPAKPAEPTNTGKNTGVQGENTGKTGDQSQGQNTGKRR